jgi:hypothetical protein
MKYEIGDKIVVLMTDEEGTVVDIINDKMVLIEVRGVRFPTYTDQIDFPYFKMFSQKLKKPPEKKKIYIDELKREKQTSRMTPKGEGVRLVFFPIFDKDVFEDDIVEKLKVYLVNDNAEVYQFDYKISFGADPSFELKNEIRAGADFYLHDIDFDDISSNPKFDVVFSLSKPDKRKAPYFETQLKLKGKQVFKRIEELHLKNEASFSYDLFIVYPDKKSEDKIDLSKLNKAGFKVYDIGEAREYLPPARTLLDLHIDKLSDQPEKLKADQILDIQLREFEKYFDLALAHKLPQLTVIHGIGAGILRDAIHQELKLKKQVIRFVNQYDPRFGYGATEIFFAYK